MAKTLNDQLGTYYQDQLAKVFKNGKGQYAPTFKIHGSDTGEDTKWMDLNEISAAVLVKWLTENFIK